MQASRAVRPLLRSFALASIIALGASGCGVFGGGSSEHKMAAAPSNLAGEGTVEASAGENDNTQLEVSVRHLAAPEKVAADASVYVVWIKPRNAPIQNIGALEVDDDLTGELKTTTPHVAFTLTVTPEPSSRMTEPSHAAVFTAHVDRDD